MSVYDGWQNSTDSGGLHDLEALEDEKKKNLYDLMDTYIRDAKARKAYAS